MNHEGAGRKADNQKCKITEKSSKTPSNFTYIRITIAFVKYKHPTKEPNEKRYE